MSYYGSYIKDVRPKSDFLDTPPLIQHCPFGRPTPPVYGHPDRIARKRPKRKICCGQAARGQEVSDSDADSEMLFSLSFWNIRSMVVHIGLVHTSLPF